MPRESDVPLCYAVVAPGLEAIAAEEITKDFGGEIKRSGHGVVVFRVPEIDGSLLKLRTTEDVYLLAWGTDELTYRAEDLDRIRRWTEKDARWDNLLRIHHAIRPKPKGRPTYRLVTQMTGTHGYRRVDAGKAVARGLTGKLPASWPHVEENASVEIWLTIHGATAVCGLRLSDHSMRHRTYKSEHRPASLRPTIAAAMVRLAEIGHGDVVVDPMCGVGTILGEAVAHIRMQRKKALILGGDVDYSACVAARDNLRRMEVLVSRWEAEYLPLPKASVACIISNPPFGKQLSNPNEIKHLYPMMIRGYDRILKPGGRAVLLVGDYPLLKEAIGQRAWKQIREQRVLVLGQRASLSAWRKIS